MQPVCLTIAGSDSGGGAGIQADLRTFVANGAFGCSVITAVTAQNPRAVTGIYALPVAGIVAQYRAVLAAFRLGAIKTGMLFSAEIVAAVAAELAARPAGLPLVVDPVMVATSGARLLQDDAVAALRRQLLPLATLITPNLPEARLLSGRPLASAAEARAAALELATQLGTAVLLKGGHGSGETAADWLAAGGRLWLLSSPRLTPEATHGTGCTLSAAIAARLAAGDPLPQAVRYAKAFVYGSLQHCVAVGENLSAMFPPPQVELEAIAWREEQV